MNRCDAQWRNLRCEREANHERMHRAGFTTWGFRGLEPEWMKRRRTIGLPAKVLPL